MSRYKGIVLGGPEHGRSLSRRYPQYTVVASTQPFGIYFSRVDEGTDEMGAYCVKRYTYEWTLFQFFGHSFGLWAELGADIGELTANNYQTIAMWLAAN